MKTRTIAVLAVSLLFLVTSCRSADSKARTTARSSDGELDDESPYPAAPTITIGAAISTALSRQPQCRFVHAEFEPVDEDEGEDEGSQATARWLVVLADKDCMRAVYVDASNGKILSTVEEREPEVLAFLAELARDAERPALDFRRLIDAGTAHVPGSWAIAAGVNPPGAPAPYSVFLIDDRTCKQALLSKDAVVVEVRDTRMYEADEDEEQMEALQESMGGTPPGN